MPHDDFVIASDRDDVPFARANDRVMGIGAGTKTMATTMVPQHGGRVIDLGTGCGLLALIAARTANQVLAVDLNPRGLAFAELNAALNDARNVTTRIVDMYGLDADLHGQFDGVVCHPPHVISPESDQLYCDASGVGDEFMKSVLTACSKLLRAGGVAQTLGNLIDREHAPWRQRLADWLSETPCDAWALANPLEDPEAYARRWLSDRTLGDRSSVEDGTLRKWLAYYDQHEIAGVCSVLVTLRRRADDRQPWVSIDPAPPTISAGAGDHVMRGIEARDLLAVKLEDKAFGQLCPDTPPELRQHIELRPTEDGWQQSSYKTHLSTGLHYGLEHDQLVGALIRACDGETTVDGAVEMVASEVGRDPAELYAPAHTAIRHLLRLGLLTARDEDAPPRTRG